MKKCKKWIVNYDKTNERLFLIFFFIFIMLQHRGRALPEVEQQHYSADRLSFQYIFYGLLFYTRKYNL